MTLAWTTVVVALLLMPGVLFLVGIGLPEPFTRTASPRNSLAQFACAVLASVVVHAIWLAGIRLIAGLGMPQPDVPTLLALLRLGSAESATHPDLVSAISGGLPWMTAYLCATAMTGTALGWALGRRMARGSFRALTEHAWALDLPMAERFAVTYVHVLTNVAATERRLVCEGRLDHFALRSDGQFAYLILGAPHHTYLHLDGKDDPVLAAQDRGGQPHALALEVPPRLFIPASEIAQVVLDPHRFTALRRAEIRDLEARVRKLEDQQKRRTRKAASRA